MILSGATGQTLMASTDPVSEGGKLILVCESVGGIPPPRLTWYKDKVVVDDVVEEVDAGRRGVVRNTLRLRNLRRTDHGADLSCKASNTNLTSPAVTRIKVNMVCKYPIHIILFSRASFYGA